MVATRHISMSTLFIIQDEQMPSSRVRVLNLAPELRQAGIGVEWIKHNHSLRDKLALLKRCQAFDVVVLQKALVAPLELLFLRAVARKLIYDFDDAVYCRHDMNGTLESRARRMKFNGVVRWADLVVAGNRTLAARARGKARRVVVVPSAVETRGVLTNAHDRDSAPVIIGWVGGQVNLHHLEGLAPVLRTLSSELPIELRVLSSETVNLPGVNVRFVPWQLKSQEQEIARFDIGVMPLPANQHSEGKCGYKALQYMAAAVPPVVSDVGVNAEIVEHGRSGLVARTEGEFYEHLRSLALDRTLRQDLGNRARKRVEEHYSVELVGRQLADILKGMHAGNRPGSLKVDG